MEVSCKHCGDKCPPGPPVYNKHAFCCQGCMMIYRLLEENDLDGYYDLSDKPGQSAKGNSSIDYAYLDQPAIAEQLISFSAGDRRTVFMDLPQIHCSACVYLLEKLPKLNPGVVSSRVDFLMKRATIIYDVNYVSLRQVVELLTRIGYKPTLTFDRLMSTERSTQDHSLIYKIGLSGFCFGNIMLLSFPDYLGFERDSILSSIGFINLFLALPVFFYAGWGYIDSAFQSIRNRDMGIDIPIAIGMITLFLRSIYELYIGAGSGYLDSLTGFVFFLLIGRWFQNFTYSSISFDRDYSSFFPISVKCLVNGKWKDRMINRLEPGDYIKVHHKELIPCDGILENGQAQIDYSFVTGESEYISAEIGQSVSAGGLQVGGPIQVRVIKSLDQSRLTQLWRNDVFVRGSDNNRSGVIDTIGRYFTISIITVACLTLSYWLLVDPTLAFSSFTSVLIIACPCVIALSIPFLYGHAIRQLSDIDVYIKNTDTLYRIAEMDHVVFDKTGTITSISDSTPIFIGEKLTSTEKSRIKCTAQQSHHPLSIAISDLLINEDELMPTYVQVCAGKGVQATIHGHEIKLGSPTFLGITDMLLFTSKQSVFVSFDGVYRGHFIFENQVREGMQRIIQNLQKHHHLTILSGDYAMHNDDISTIFPASTPFHFNQSPMDKLNYIELLQKAGHHVMMVGDGLNDAGALRQSDVGVVLAYGENSFTPASDIILNSDSFVYLNEIKTYGQYLRYALYVGFVLAAIYNIVGLYFATTGRLSPIVAAILMPISSISIVVYGVSVSHVIFKSLFRY